jgi:hypothetical protein
MQRQHVLQVAFVVVRPQMPVGVGVDQLHGDADLLVAPFHGALDDSVDTQFARDRRQGGASALEAHDRRARDDAQPDDLRQLRDERIGHAVGEVVLFGIPGEVR